MLLRLSLPLLEARLNPLKTCVEWQKGKGFLRSWVNGAGPLGGDGAGCFNLKTTFSSHKIMCRKCESFSCKLAWGFSPVSVLFLGVPVCKVLIGWRHRS